MSHAGNRRGVIIVFVGSAIMALLAFYLMWKGSRTHLQDAQPASDAPAENAPAAPTSTDENAAPATDAPTSGAATPLSPQTQAKLRVLDEILASRNDNDPRLDTELRDLSPEARRALEAKYQSLRKEDRNGRGTIVFLIGRDPKGTEDFAFLQNVLGEAPCLSLSDCGQLMKPGSGEEAHGDSGIEVTLNYPQLVALSSIERLMERTGASGLSPGQLDWIRRTIQAGKISDAPAVARKAEELEARLPEA